MLSQPLREVHPSNFLHVQSAPKLAISYRICEKEIIGKSKARNNTYFGHGSESSMSGCQIVAVQWGEPLVFPDALCHYPSIFVGT